MAARQVLNSEGSNVIQWDELLQRASIERFGRNARVNIATPITKEDKAQFLKLLFSEARDVNPRVPQEISRTVVDIYEKTYYNHGEGEDETTVTIGNLVENAEGHNYLHISTKGVEFGSDVGKQFGLPPAQVSSSGLPQVDTSSRPQGGASGRAQVSVGLPQVNISGLVPGIPGLPVGLPQVSVSGELGVRGGDKEQKQTEMTKSNRVEITSQHKETMSVPPGEKVVVRMIFYKVRYKLEYTMEYKIAKSAQIRISIIRSRMCRRQTQLQRAVTARDLLQYLPGFREDEEFVYFTQDGELRWIADGMEVEKKIVPRI